MTFPDLIAALDRLGARVVVRNGKRGIDCPAIHRSAVLLLREWLEAHGDAVAAHYAREPTKEVVLCPLCRRDCTNDEDRERLAQINPFCTQGALPAVWRDGKQVKPAVSGCPFRVQG